MLIASVLLASKTSPVRHPKGELSTLLIHEQDGGLLHPVGIVAWGGWHIDDAPFSTETHAGIVRSSGSRIRLCAVAKVKASTGLPSP